MQVNIIIYFAFLHDVIEKHQYAMEVKEYKNAYQYLFDIFHYTKPFGEIQTIVAGELIYRIESFTNLAILLTSRLFKKKNECGDKGMS